MLKLTQKLPADRQAAATGYEDIEALRRILATDERKLKQAETRFRSVNAEALELVQRLQDEIAEAFGKYLQLFLKEKAALVYQTIKNRVGQGGESFDFPAFRLALGGGAVTGAQERLSTKRVSSSSRLPPCCADARIERKGSFRTTREPAGLASSERIAVTGMETPT